MPSSERDPKPTLSDRLAWAPPSWGRFAYVPERILVRGSAALDQLDRILGSGHEGKPIDRRDTVDEAAWRLVERVDDPLAAVAALRADGFQATPDHVLFAHAGDCCCGPHPAWTSDAHHADPYKSNPYKSNPYKSNPYKSNDPQTSSAVPAPGRAFPERALDPQRPPVITVLDTGLAQDPQRPALIDPNRITGDAELPDAYLPGSGGTPTPPDAWLDPVAGHGTFIAGVIEQLTPGCTVRVRHVVDPLGAADESTVFLKIVAEALRSDPPDLLSLSFGGRALKMAPALRAAVAFAQAKGIVIVASAGNDGSCEPQYPAAHDGVIAVGALGPDGPAPWTNYGEWVDACAPGCDLVSAFFKDFDGNEPMVNGVDPDRFREWACWSGTSFAAPVVVAAIAREMVLGSASAAQAAERVVRAPANLRIRGLGTVVTP